MFLARVLMKSEYTCGGTGLIFSGSFPYIVSMVVLLIKIAVPILLIIFGMLDLGKAVVAAKEDEIKKGQQMFIKRLLIAALIFFVIVITKFLISIIADNNSTNIIDCIDCFVDDKNCKEE